MFSDNAASNEFKNVLKGDYVGILQNDLFLRLYNEFELLSKSNFSSNVVKHLNDYLLLNPFEYVPIISSSTTVLKYSIEYVFHSILENM